VFDFSATSGFVALFFASFIAATVLPEIGRAHV